ncbi:DDE_3 domain-containing protein [Trichonephila clavipes]|nr:DDE_3 domain-containing protein [Trichonephila clavipes]
MDDNATCHRTLAVQDCLDSEGTQRLVWPARSPDLNPIENVWDALGRQVAGRNYPPTNKNTLIRALTEEWDKLPQQLLDNVVQSMHGLSGWCNHVTSAESRIGHVFKTCLYELFDDVCSSMDSQLGDHGCSYFRRCITDRIVFNEVINDKPGCTNGETSFYQMNPGSVYSIKMVASVHCPIKTELSYESLRKWEDVASKSRGRSDFHQDVGNHKETLIALNREVQLVKLMA